MARAKATNSGLLGLGSHRTLNNSCSEALVVFSASMGGSTAVAAAVVVAAVGAAAANVLAGIDEGVRRSDGCAAISRPKGSTPRGFLAGNAKASVPLDPFKLLRRNTAIVQRSRQCNTNAHVSFRLCFSASRPALCGNNSEGNQNASQ